MFVKNFGENSTLMRSVPRISYDMKQCSRIETEFDPIIEESDIKTSFYATRRDFLYTTFIEDPQLVLKRQKELEEERANKIKQKQIHNLPPPTPPPPSPPINKKSKTQKSSSKAESRSIKKLTKSEICNVVDRLASVSENNSKIKNHQSIRRNISSQRNNIEKEKNHLKKKINDEEIDAVFDRLYYESTQLKEEKKKNLTNFENHDYQNQENDTYIITKSIVHQRIKEMIDSSFPDKQAITINEINDIFIRLGILENCEKIEKIPQISNIIYKWKIRNTEFYDSNIIRDTLMQSIMGSKGKFKHFARERMFSALANRKNNENKKSNQDSWYPNQSVTHSKRLTQETFDRLLSPRPDFSASKNNEEEDVNNVHFELSPRTQKILKGSEYGNVSIEERDKKLAERAMAKIEEIRKQMENERTKMQKKNHASVPRITPEERAKINELKQKRQNEIENDKPSYKPDVMKYSDFLQLKESMKEKKDKPNGIDSFLERMKKGYEQHQKKKFDEENIRMLPKLPSKKKILKKEKRKVDST